MKVRETLERDWHDPQLRGPSEGYDSPRAEFLRAALVEIAESKSLTATSTQFAAHLQRLACKALTADARAEPPEMSTSVGTTPALGPKSKENPTSADIAVIPHFSR